MADNNIQSVTDGNFETEVLSASNAQPVMVDFWADWCRPCHMLAPTVAEIAHDYAGKLKVMKLNVDEAINSAGRYNVRGIPTLLVFKNGQVVEQIVGAVPKDQITKALAKHLAYALARILGPKSVFLYDSFLNGASHTSSTRRLYFELVYKTFHAKQQNK